MSCNQNCRQGRDCNSWAVPVVRWIGERINAAVERIKHEV